MSSLDFRGRHRVAVTGLGVKSPAGNDLDTFWARLCSGDSAGARISRYDPAELTVQIGCEVPEFDVEKYITMKEARRLDRSAVLGISSSVDALADASDPRIDPARCAVVGGAGIGGLITLEEQVEIRFTKGARSVSPLLVPMMMPNATAAGVSLRFGWTGPNFTVATACAASTNAIGDAAELIRHGTADVVMVVGAESCQTKTAISAFARMTALSGRNDDPARASRPFDAGRDGFVMGEGAGALLLERMDLAVERGARIYAEFGGYGRNSDAHHITAPSPGGEGAVACMKLALADAGLDPSAVGHINAHGTSTPLNDSAESAAIFKVFGDDGPVVTSTKGVTGHMIGAAGAVEAIAAILAMRSESVPPTANLERLGDDITIDVVAGTPRFVPSKPSMSNSFGFGGHNASVIFLPAPSGVE